MQVPNIPVSVTSQPPVKPVAKPSGHNPPPLANIPLGMAGQAAKAHPVAVKPAHIANIPTGMAGGQLPNMPIGMAGQPPIRMKGTIIGALAASGNS